MATLDGARAAGLEDEIGSLDVGKKADIAIFDMRRPHVGVLQRPLSAFVCAGKGSDAKVVMVGGKIVYRDGRFMNGPKPGDVLHEAEKLGGNIIRSAGLSDLLVSHWPVQRAMSTTQAYS
jgi:5-methylthioadenosine/S-adenosylhomocysteine deaminase